MLTTAGSPIKYSQEILTLLDAVLLSKQISDARTFWGLCFLWNSCHNCFQCGTLFCRPSDWTIPRNSSFASLAILYPLYFGVSSTSESSASSSSKRLCPIKLSNYIPYLPFSILNFPLHRGVSGRRIPSSLSLETWLERTLLLETIGSAMNGPMLAKFLSGLSSISLILSWLVHSPFKFYCTSNSLNKDHSPPNKPPHHLVLMDVSKYLWDTKILT
jgi:hypothetical protein